MFFDPEKHWIKKHEFRQRFEPEQEYRGDRRNKPLRFYVDIVELSA